MNRVLWVLVLLQVVSAAMSVALQRYWGTVLPEGTAVFRPVEIAILRGPDRTFTYGGLSTYWDPPAADREEMRDVARRVGEHLRTTRGYTGMFGIDGVLTADGFRPTELNPRMSAGAAAVAASVDRRLFLLLQANLVAGRDSVTEVPTSRWQVPAGARARWGAFLDDVAGFDAEFFGLARELLLHLLHLLHHLANVHYLISSTSRISAGKTSSIACTPPSASALAFRSASGGAGAGGSIAAAGRGPGGSDALPRAVVTTTRRPATGSASDSSHCRLASTC